LGASGDVVSFIKGSLKTKTRKPAKQISLFSYLN